MCFLLLVSLLIYKCVCQSVLVPSQHILGRACKFDNDTAQEAQLTVGTLNAKLDDLSRALNKVHGGLLRSLLVERWQSVMNGVVNPCQSIMNDSHSHCRSLKSQSSPG